ncbi:hypothetical protein SteCoe_8535 [Stentor coeruleus]|uniref:Uncharacterized protein n=1 Tax=Stentor coeruleus TaxID=5963 RepID=A0A1R2CJX6_9CILI|nr:hypothetical protein SteCoe_8535 [Stentor coeruleus]
MSNLHSSRSLKSNTSYASTSVALCRMFDFVSSHIPGLFKVTSKHFLLEYKEDLNSTNLSLRISKTNIIPELIQIKVIKYGLEYTAHIRILHDNYDEFFILIPECRSYDPAGTTKPYLDFQQYLFISKLIAIEIRAAILGIPEHQVDDIFVSIQKVSQIYQSVKELAEWVHLQIKCACFMRINSPSYYELLLNKASLGDFELNSRDHCKEYLESCLEGGEVVLPRLYFQSVLDNEHKLPFEKKNQFAEVIRKDSIKPRAVLYYLPKAVPQMVYVRQGKNYTQIVNDIEKFYAGHKSVENMAVCNVF